MEIPTSDIRCAISIRGIRSSTTKEMISNYCENYGKISYFHGAFSPQGIMRGYNVVFHDEQSVNRFMDARPHQIDGQSVKVKRCISPNEECRLTAEILLTTSDNSLDDHIFQEQTLRDYFSKYGLIRACRIEQYHDHPCAYMTFKDYDRVDQLINDKPHMIKQVLLHIRKYVSSDHQTSIKRAIHSSNDSRNKQRRRSSSNNSSQIEIKQRTTSCCQEPSIHETSTNGDCEISQLENQYEQIHRQIVDVNQADDHRLHQLESNVENLLEQIRQLQSKKQTFVEQLFSKYTIPYILSLTKNDLNEKLEQLEKERHLLRLIKQNLP